VGSGPRLEGARSQQGRILSLEHSDTDRARESRQEIALERIELERRHHEDLGIVEPGRIVEALRCRSEHRSRIGEAPLDGFDEAPVEEPEGAEPLAVEWEGRGGGQGVEALRRNARHAQRGQGAGEDAGHGRPRKARVDGKAVFALEQAQGQEGIMPGVPGAEPTPEQQGLSE